MTRRHLCLEHGQPLWREAAADVEPRLRDAPQEAVEELRWLPGRSL